MYALHANKDRLESSLEVVTFQGRCAILVRYDGERELRDVRSVRMIFTRLGGRIRIVGIAIIS